MLQENRDVAVYRWIEFVHWFAYGLVFPVFVLYLHEERGFNMGKVGWLTAYFWILMIVFQIPTGLAADRFGRKNVFCAAALISSIAMWLHASFTLFWLFFISQAVNALARAFVDGAMQSWIIEQAGIRNNTGRARIASIGQWSFGYSIALAGIISCVFAAYRKTYVVSFYAAGAILIALAIIGSFLIKETSRLQNEPSSNRRALPRLMQETWRLIREKPLLRTTIVFGFFSALTFSSVALFWPVYVKSLKTFAAWQIDSLVVIGLLYAVFTMLWVWGGSLASQNVSRGGNSASILRGAVYLGILGHLLIAFGAGLPLAFSFGLLFFYIGYGAFIPITRQYVHRCASDNVRATVLSAYFMAGAIGAALGLWGAGHAIEYFSFFWMWLGSLGIFTISMLTLLPRLKKYDTEP